MTWVEVTVETHREAVEAVANLLQDAGANGTVIDDPALRGDSDYFAIPLPPSDRSDVKVRAYLPENDLVGEKVAFIRKQLDFFRQFLQIGTGEITLRPVQDDEWADSWKQHYKPQRIGRRLVVVPSWEPPGENPDRIAIYLDPGMAFGTGTHPTTRRCLQVLEEHVTGGEEVYDVGTGTGILAIAAAKLGAGRVTGIDLDPVAVQVARDNVALNKVQTTVTIREGDMLSVCSSPVHLVMANIIADAVIMLAGSIPRYLLPGGSFLAAGIIEGRREETLRAVSETGLRIREIHQDGEWITILASKG